MKSWSRKDFLKTSLLGGGAAILGKSSPLYGQGSAAIASSGSANGDIRIGIVGLRGRGNGHIKNYYPGKQRGTRLAALCDVDSAVITQRTAETESAAGIKLRGYRDYRKLLENKDIDAVVIATPNHWHSLMTIWALEAGKDVYVEKPMSHNIWEGRQAVEAAFKYSDRIVQAGTQNRSSVDIPRAIEYVRSGKLGKIVLGRALCYKARESIGRHFGPQPVSDSIDYNLWTGPADLIPPHRNSPQNGTVHYDWHWFWNYGGGDIANQGIHQMDVARWFLGESSLPASVMTFGGRFGYIDDAETPNTEVSIFNYKNAPLVFEVRGLPMKAGMKAMDSYRGSRVGVIIHCEGGYVQVSESGTCGIYDSSNKKIVQFQDGGLGGHPANFVAAMRSRKQADLHGHIENCHISTNLCHLANISYLVGAERSDIELMDAIRSSSELMEVHGRVVEHLIANGVKIDTAKIVSGPLLEIDNAAERFVGKNRMLVDKANSSILMKRVGREGFRIPEYGPRHATVS
ncbi:MAG: Gfo/Idh/MocA family oxidoreductase [Opitutaceae bacterium]|nr:Gfo/Idh/MocA family oxidoreductase [Opitutaceae bacterium]